MSVTAIEAPAQISTPQPHNSNSQSRDHTVQSARHPPTHPPHLPDAGTQTSARCMTALLTLPPAAPPAAAAWDGINRRARAPDALWMTMALAPATAPLCASDSMRAYLDEAQAI